MVIDKLENAGLYTGLTERLAAALRYVQQTDFRKLAPGRYDVRGNQIYALVQQYTPRARADAQWEAHRTYYDLQVLVDGREHFGYVNLKDIKVTQEYDAKDDALLGEGEGEFLVITPGTFLILGPQDAHMPAVAPPGDNGPVKKVVVKVMV